MFAGAADDYLVVGWKAGQVVDHRPGDGVHVEFMIAFHAILLHRACAAVPVAKARINAHMMPR